MLPRGHRRGLSALLLRPTALCASKLPSKELLSIRSRRPRHFRAKTLICLQKHIDLLQSAMKGSACPPKQDSGHTGAWLGFPKHKWDEGTPVHAPSHSSTPLLHQSPSPITAQLCKPLGSKRKASKP